MIYVGHGFIPGVPARDLSEDDIKKLVNDLDLLSIAELKRALVDSGLYTEAAEEEKILNPKRENKSLL